MVNEAARLAVFDLDGTLTDTGAVDKECYMAALDEVFSLADVGDDWDGCEHRTDQGVAEFLLARHLGRALRSDDMERLRDRLIRRLEGVRERDLTGFREVPGAGAFLASLPGRGWRTCVATGCWALSAELKLSAAGLVVDGPLVGSDRHPRRVDIVGTAVAAARKYHGVSAFERIVLLGDTPNDVRAARDLGLPFVGIAPLPRHGEMRTAGAATVLPDYQDAEAAHAALESASVPTG